MLKNREDLQKTREVYKKRLDQQKKKILICAGTACVASGSLAIYDEFLKLINEKGINCSVDLQHETEGEHIGIKKSGCHGFCEMGPLIRIEPKGYLYVKVKPSDCAAIFQNHALLKLVKRNGLLMFMHFSAFLINEAFHTIIIYNAGF